MIRTGARPGIDYDLLAKPDTLRALALEQGLSDAEIGKRAGCSPWTVERWRQLFEIRRPVGGRRTKGSHGGLGAHSRPSGQMTRERFREVVARAYVRQGRCWQGCPRREDCLDDEGPCQMVAA